MWSRTPWMGGGDKFCAVRGREWPVPGGLDVSAGCTPIQALCLPGRWATGHRHWYWPGRESEVRDVRIKPKFASARPW